MWRLDLGGEWELTCGPQDPADLWGERGPYADWQQLPAAVPGNVELDLIRAGLLPADLQRGHQIYQLRELETWAWWYHRAFELPALPPAPVELVCEGIDCTAEVYLNGQWVGGADNMLHAHRFGLDGLRLGSNSLEVRISSPLLVQRDQPLLPDAHAAPGNWESLLVRKAPHMYGWDIMPRAVSAGIWRPIYLEAVPATRVRWAYWTTRWVDPAGARAGVRLDWQLATDQRSLDGWQLTAELCRDGRVAASQTRPVLGLRGQFGLEVAEAALWWPRGYGAAPLYEARLTLRDAAGELQAEHSTRIGLRTIELQRTDVIDDQGGDFCFVVNGERIFCQGTNWVPLDAFHSRDRQHLPAACAMLADLHCNMVRFWGGNVYEVDAFFDFCDEAGILVWQDFALACAIYPHTTGLRSQLLREAEVEVERLRQHPCLALWAGNNEIDDAYVWSGSGRDPNSDVYSRQLLPGVLQRLDPTRPYLPSSPYRSPELVRRGNHNQLKPEDHLWGPRDDFKGPTYTGSNALFVSEIGYHGCPERATLEALCDADQLWPWQGNEQWLTHAVRPQPADTSYNYRIELMAKQIGVLFDTVPAELDAYWLASQISQAEALKFFLERWRGDPRRTGMLWWNLRDGWPILSDAIVDYYNRRKLAYPYLQRLQGNPLLLLAEPVAGRQELRAVNQTRGAVAGQFAVRDLDSAELLLAGRFELPAHGHRTLGSVAESAVRAMRWIEWQLDGGGTGCNHYLAGPRPFDLRQYAGWITRLRLPADLAAVQEAARQA
ncbi:MAG: hypothetical protein IT204_01880 [Fimbriimonadaceae bacterium]|nr:hypothetical protein [Fimbriimonadaceae bacterium]